MANAMTGEELMRSMAKSMPTASRPQVRGRYDAAQTNSENRKHWELVDGMSAASANSIGVRQLLRNRSRYEVANNSYARGIVNTKTNHVIGTCPRLQIQTGTPEADEEIEELFSRWSKAVNLGAKLRTMQAAKIQDGESFAILKTNPAVNDMVQIDLSLVECDRVTSPWGFDEFAPGKIDGISFDANETPVSYTVLRYHPGDAGIFNSIYNAFDIIDAVDVLHWFRADRPGQVRGVPEIMPALPLFAQLRRYTLATISAAETAANFAMVAQSNLAPEEDQAADPFEEIELTRNMVTVLPQGYTLGQVDPKQPVTGYKEFKWEILNEIARCLDMPFNIAACNSSGYNYSSGRLDHQTYYRGICIEQHECERVILARVFSAWFDEAVLMKLIPENLPPMADWSLQWHWDGQPSADAVKDATADQLDLENGAENMSSIIARRGGDWRKVMRQRAIELQYKQELETEFGVTFPSATPMPVAPTNSPDNQQPQEGDYANQAA